MQYLGDFAEDSTVYIPFNTFSSDDPQASVTATTLIASDIKVHKDGSVTDIVTDGATIAIDFDTITGNHLITIDTSASADYSTGSDYLVRIEGATVDAGNINAIVGSFSIENRFNAAADDLANVTDGLGALKTVVDAILVDTGTTIPATISTAQADLDTITGTDGATLASTQGNTITWSAQIYSVTGATDNITFNGSGSGAVFAYTRGGTSSLFDAAYSTDLQAEVNAACDTALTDYDAATGTELAATEAKIDTAQTSLDDIPTVAEFEARTPTAAQLAYITRHAATALPVTFTGGTTTTAVLGNVDGVAASTTDDVYNSRLLVFNAGTLNEQVCQITDYAGSTATVTITAVTTAVTSSHTAVLV